MAENRLQPSDNATATALAIAVDLVMRELDSPAGRARESAEKGTPESIAFARANLIGRVAQKLLTPDQDKY